MTFDQAASDIRCEWGARGLAALAAALEVGRESYERVVASLATD